MSWSTIIWSMATAACLALAGLYLLIRFGQRGRRDYALLVSSVSAAAALAAFGVAMTRVMTVAEYGNLLYRVHIPLAMLIVSVVWVRRLGLGAGMNYGKWWADRMFPRVPGQMIDGERLEYLNGTAPARGSSPSLGEVLQKFKRAQPGQ
jgi:hypothetical protein